MQTCFSQPENVFFLVLHGRRKKNVFTGFFNEISAYELKTNGEPRRGREEKIGVWPGRPERGPVQAKFLRDGLIPGWGRAGPACGAGPGQAGRGRASKFSEKANPERNRSTFYKRSKIQGRKEGNGVLSKRKLEKDLKKWQKMRCRKKRY